MRRAVMAVVVVLGVSACASAPIRKQDQVSLDAARVRLAEGCYQCLIEARDTFRRLAVGKARALLVPELFEAEVLVGLREQEFAVDSAESFARAEALVPELPPTHAAARYLELARRIPPDRIGTPINEMSAWTRKAPPLTEIRAVQKELETGQASTPFRQYLSKSLDCLDPVVRQTNLPVAEAAPDAPMLVKYRTWTCPAVLAWHLERIKDTVPDFVEAELLVARLPSLRISSAYTKRQREALAAAASRFPRSASVSYTSGALNQTIGDCKAAVRHYEDVIALKPLHEDAAMQRVICLAHIGSFAPAVEGATRIIDAQYYNFADAYYWRAWTHHKSGNLPSARADIESARKVQVNMRVLLLGGIIKYDQGDLELAERDLKDAVSMDAMRQQCLAHWYYGLVGFAREQWTETAGRFSVAATCYRNSAQLARRELENMRKADVDEDFRRTQIAGFEAAIKEDTDQEHASYLNAANTFARAGDLEKAREWLAKVPSDSVHALIAEQLRKEIGGS